MIDERDMQRLRDEFAPTPDAVERMRRAIDMSAVRERAPQPRRRWGIRSTRIRVGAAVASACLLAAVVALSPFERGSSHSIVPAPTTARAALEHAAAAAGAAEWHPLAEGEYHHLMSTTFVPRIPVRAGDPQSKIDQMFGTLAPGSKETWIASSGDSFSLRAMGGNGNPKLFPSYQVIGRGGLGFGPTYGRNYPKRDVVDTERSLRLADMVTVERTKAATASHAYWVRTAAGWKRVQRTVGPPPAGTGMSFGEMSQRRNWSVTYEDVAAINDASSAAFDAEVRRLLDSPTEGFGGGMQPMGMFGVTKAQVQEEERIVRAVELLGAAPLSPTARRALFTWLSKRPLAKLGGAATDESGRRGTRVTFERISKRTVPSHTVTQEEMREEWARLHGGVEPKNVVGAKAVVVKEDQQFRRWYVSIIFDSTTGELLQTEVYGRQETTAPQPSIQMGRVKFSPHRTGMTDAALYGVRERATGFEQPRTLVCKVDPTVCKVPVL